MMQQLPLGFQERIIFSLRSLYNRHGYSQYKMSKFEEYDLYARNKDFLFSDSAITFLDTNGKLMALKPDVTLSIVKNTRDGCPTLQKLYYNEHVYRVSKNSNSFREQTQVGLECLGPIDDCAVFEVLTLAAESLLTVSDSSILDISHLGLLSGLIDGLGIPVGRKKDLMALIGSKSRHEAAALCRQLGVRQELIDILEQVVSLSGPPAQVLPRMLALLSPVTDTAPLSRLLSVTQALEGTPAGRILRFDLSAVDDIRYYNGLVFKGYIHGLPSAVLSGGQYDNLMRRMHRSAGALGFALYLDGLERLDTARKEFDVDCLILYGPKTPLARIREQIAAQTGAGESFLLQQTVPADLRFRHCIHLPGSEVDQ